MYISSRIGTFRLPAQQVGKRKVNGHLRSDFPDDMTDEEMMAAYCVASQG